MQSGFNINPLRNSELIELNNRINFYIQRYTELIKAVVIETVLPDGYENLDNGGNYFKDSMEIVSKF